MIPRLSSGAMLIPTAEGEFSAYYSERGLCRLEFPSGTKPPKGAANPVRASAQVRKWHAVTRQALKLMLAGRQPKSLPPLDLSGGTDFQQRVWQAMRSIAWGQTWSYGRVAQAIENPKAVRAVGSACGANPIPVLVPCHRVVAANSGGLDWKRRLLAIEGVTIPGAR
ncbi:MAG: methylated-DNA--[protein]-cysteine S-methyltransferase [Verrucomicrobia bacterium]|nr:methylated-DNA--[protein]-cysteine S-methyltransferase [Verrucomicrobiota bacterium]